MSEKQKMLNGKPHLTSEDILIKERRSAAELIKEYNLTTSEEQHKRHELIHRLFGKTDENFYIEAPFRCDYGYNIEIGNHVFINTNCLILDSAKVIIGNRVLIGPNVSIFTAGHPIHWEIRNTGLCRALPVIIEDDVWIGGNVTINQGVHIGPHCVIGSGSVLTRDIPSNVVAAGNPCRVLRKITEGDKNGWEITNMMK